MKLVMQIMFLCFSLAASLSAQSGRIKPIETPTPKRSPGAYNPTEIGETATVKPAPTATSATIAKRDDDDIIKVESVLVPIPASVLDWQGQTIRNLKLEDFELRINGQTAEISEVAQSQSPVSLALLFDNSSSVLQAREFEKKAAIRFFRQVIRPDRDQVALYSVATVTRLEQPLTRNVSQLIAAIESFEKPEGATQLLDGIIQAAEYLRDYPGRRVIVIVSDGEDNLSDSSLEAAVKAVQLSNCQVYVVKTTEFENLQRTGSRAGNANVRALIAERRMQEITSDTGGAVYSPVDEDELNQAFMRISAELAEQYILSYYPETTGEKGKFQTITLNVKNKKDLTLRTRKGYYIPKKN